MVKRTGAGLAVVVLMVALLTMGALAQDGSQHTLAIFSTTDLHQYIMPYNYIDDQPNENIGLTKVYTLLEEARRSIPTPSYSRPGMIFRVVWWGIWKQRLIP